jgi:hypothetical protein
MRDPMGSTQLGQAGPGSRAGLMRPGQSVASLRRLVLAALAAGCTVLVCYALPPIAHAEGAGDGCPNEAIRLEQGVSEYLPDCRAYEMVTPAYKEGYPMLVFKSGYSSTGEKAILYSLGDLAGDIGQGQTIEGAALYSDTRSASGWQLASLNPPLSEFVGQIPVAVEANSGETLWLQHSPEQSALTQNLYIRSTTGAFSLVGPASLPLKGEEEPSNEIVASEDGRSDLPIAATSDYEHVVLFGSVPEDYWSFDETEGAGSLYEYSGTDNSQPILVGVMGSKESRHLISTCGTHFGGAGSTYNALSADGESIFFTVSAGCGALGSAEVYARLHGSVVSPQAASTVDVSASECTLGGPACGGESGKNFEGASESGQRVFFTSTQKLTNEAINGTVSGNAAEENGCSTIAAGAGGCDLYEYNFAATEHERLRLVEGGEVLGVTGVAENGAHVYYVSRSQVPGAGVNVLEQGPIAGQPNLYVYNAVVDETKFIGTLEEKDSSVWRKEFGRRPVEVAGDEGQFLLFASSTPGLTSDDTSALEQLFEYDAETGELVRVTQGENGYDNNGNDVTKGLELSSIESAARSLGGGFDFKSSVNQLDVSGNGATVFFVTAGELSSRAVSAKVGCLSVYEFRTAGKLSEGVVHLVSDGSDTQLYKGVYCGAQLQAMDASGVNVLFTTADPLLSGDTDGFEQDIYDAREDGGFPLASGGEDGVCGSGSCEVSSGGPPVLPVASSTTSTGEGGVAPGVVKSVSASDKRKAKKKVKKARGKVDRRRVLSACGRRAGIRRMVCAGAIAQWRHGLKGKNASPGGSR